MKHDIKEDKKVILIQRGKNTYNLFIINYCFIQSFFIKRAVANYVMRDVRHCIEERKM